MDWNVLYCSISSSNFVVKTRLNREQCVQILERLYVRLAFVQKNIPETWR